MSWPTSQQLLYGLNHAQESEASRICFPQHIAGDFVPARCDCATRGQTPHTFDQAPLRTYIEPLWNAVPCGRHFDFEGRPRLQNRTWSAPLASALLPTYARADLAFERGDGAWLTSTKGERYLDFGGGIAVASLGYSHPHLVEALTEQAGKLWHTSNLFQIPEGERFAKRLAEATFADYVFFTNSGAEALELAIKVARRYQYVSGRPERFRIIGFEGAFHGRTLATLAAAGTPKYLEGFGPKAEGFDQVPYGDIEALKH